MTACTCTHPRHHHAAGGVCTTITVAGPPVPKQYWGAAAELHMGRTLNYCTCSNYAAAAPKDVPAPRPNTAQTNQHTTERTHQ